MPGFYTAGTGVPLEHRVEDARAAARVLSIHWESLRRDEGALVFVPPPEPVAGDLVEAAVAEALEAARAQGIRGKAVTPFLLEAVARRTSGSSRRANVALLERNARVAGEIAAALAERS
jgi:pseudouridine-5'-phosphate glycosidase